MSEKIVEIKGIQKIYNKKVVLDIDYLSFQEGKIYALVGPNGSGKTTLLNILNLLIKPDQGKIFYFNQEVSWARKEQRIKLRRQMTLVEQSPYLFNTTVWNNLAFGLQARKLSYPIQKERINRILNLVDLSNFQYRKVNQLSGGEMKRVALARALVLEPRLLLLDEPTASLDQRYIDILERVIKRVNQENKTTVLITTHDLSRAYRLAQEVVSLLEGKVIKEIPENIFRGEIIKNKKGNWLKITEKVSFVVGGEKEGISYIYIDPRDIILSLQSFPSSARNSFLGKIVKIVEQNHLVKLEVDIGVLMVVIITKESFQDLRLNLGRSVYLTFKASAVKLY
ncbi:MAG: ABC transporter ATP-binding protein [Candidatus Caldatribacteriota bacterium]